MWQHNVSLHVRIMNINNANKYFKNKISTYIRFGKAGGTVNQSTMKKLFFLF